MYHMSHQDVKRTIRLLETQQYYSPRVVFLLRMRIITCCRPRSKESEERSLNI